MKVSPQKLDIASSKGTKDLNSKRWVKTYTMAARGRIDRMGCVDIGSTSLGRQDQGSHNIGTTHMRRISAGSPRSGYLVPYLHEPKLAKYLRERQRLSSSFRSQV